MPIPIYIYGNGGVTLLSEYLLLILLTSQTAGGLKSRNSSNYYFNTYKVSERMKFQSIDTTPITDTFHLARFYLHRTQVVGLLSLGKILHVPTHVPLIILFLNNRLSVL